MALELVCCLPRVQRRIRRRRKVLSKTRQKKTSERKKSANKFLSLKKTRAQTAHMMKIGSTNRQLP